ncbi:hypothetical protein BGX38DRAFT_1157043, partial [Terfezia claveryi]
MPASSYYLCSNIRLSYIGLCCLALACIAFAAPALASAALALGALTPNAGGIEDDSGRCWKERIYPPRALAS